MENQISLDETLSSRPQPIKCSCGSTNFRLEKRVYDGNEHQQRVCSDCDKPGSFSKSVSNEDFKMPFGKHRGITLVELVKSQPDYVKWLMANIDNGNLKTRLSELWSS